MSTGVLSCG